MSSEEDLYVMRVISNDNFPFSLAYKILQIK